MKARQTSARRLVREARVAKLKITSERDTWHHDMTEVHECIKRLPCREREVFVLAMLEGVPQAEVAEQLGLKVNTISGLLARARKRLQTQLKQTEVLLALALAACIPSRAPATLVQSTCQLAIDATCLSKRVVQLTYSLGEIPMRKALMLGCLAAILCCGTTVGTFLLGNSEAQDFSFPQRPTQEVTQSKEEYRPAPALQKWEYKTIRVDTNLNDSVMNKLGEQGWELCATYSTPAGQVCLTFKRHSMSIATESRLGDFYPDANKRHSGETRSMTSDYQVFHLKNSNAEEVAEILKQLMSGAKVHTDQRTNSLFVLVEEKQKNGIRQLIQRLDVEHTKQPPAKTDRRGALSDYFGR
jgi:DNA-binding CsgD family transcriptional regulator